MTFSGTLTMRQRHSPTNREEGGVGDGKGLAAVKGKGEREKEDRKEQRMEGLLSTPPSRSPHCSSEAALSRTRRRRIR